MTEPTTQTPFKEMWALVELMGHTKVAGRITEETHFGVPLMRCDIPTGDSDYFTQWYGGGSIFRITPIEEQVARAYSQRSRPAPIHPYQLALPSPSFDHEDLDDDDYDDADF